MLCQASGFRQIKARYDRPPRSSRPLPMVLCGKKTAPTHTLPACMTGLFPEVAMIALEVVLSVLSWIWEHGRAVFLA